MLWKTKTIVSFLGLFLHCVLCQVPETIYNLKLCLFDNIESLKEHGADNIFKVWNSFEKNEITDSIDVFEFITKVESLVNHAQECEFDQRVFVSWACNAKLKNIFSQGRKQVISLMLEFLPFAEISNNQSIFEGLLEASNKMKLESFKDIKEDKLPIVAKAFELLAKSCELIKKHLPLETMIKMKVLVRFTKFLQASQKEHGETFSFIQ